MKARFCYLWGLLCLLSCSGGDRVEHADATEVRFGPLREAKMSDCIRVTRVLPLETTDASLLGAVDQLEVVGDRIIILDYHSSNSVSAFSATDGRLLLRLSGTGNGPGEFLSPHSFWVGEADNSLYVMDMMLSKLIRYRLSDFSYVEEIRLPAHSPLAFAAWPDDSRFLYYYPSRSQDLFGGNQLVEADRQGGVLRSAYRAPRSGRILHGNPAAFYAHEGRLCVVPYFSDKVYEWEGDSLSLRYRLSWDNSAVPDEEVFRPDDSSVIMKRILSENCIRFLYTYENASCLAVKYYIMRDLYLSAWNKKSGAVFNVKADEVDDDLGIGGRLPLPVGVSGEEELVGCLSPRDMDGGKYDEEDNPVLVFYGLK